MLHGAVDPDGEETTYRFEYASYGSSYESVPAPNSSAGSGSGPVELTANLNGLRRNTTYRYRLAATNELGTTYGGVKTFRTSLWSVQRVPRTEETAELLGVSCPSSGFCMSVGAEHVHYEHNLLYNDEPLAERWNGGEWMQEKPPVLHPAGAGYFSRLSGASCSAPDFCMAIGVNYELGPGYQPLAERWDGREWSVTPAPTPNDASPNPLNGQRVVRMHGIACASANSCFAVGQFVQAWDSGVPERIDTLIEHWDGSSRTIEPSPDPQGSKTSILQGISCASPTSCVAVGEDRDAGGSTGTLVERWDGSSWSIDPAPTLPGGLQDVSCSSRNACLAVGGSEGRSGGDGLAEAWDGSTWTAVPAGWPMRSVSCLAADWCVGAGGDSTAHAAFAAIWDGARWLLEYPVSPSDSSDNPKEMYGVSCGSSGCTAVGWYYSWGYRPLVERLDRAFVAPRPTVVNDSATSVTETSVTLNGHVDNNGAVGDSDGGARGGSDCRFEVALKSAPDSPIAEPTCMTDPVEGDVSVAVEAQVTGLEPGTDYVYRLVASNEGGTAKATPDGQFVTSPNAPSVANDPVGSVAQTTAVLNGHVDNEDAEGGSSVSSSLP